MKLAEQVSLVSQPCGDFRGIFSKSPEGVSAGKQAGRLETRHCKTILIQT
jgi:hypothetical protein